MEKIGNSVKNEISEYKKREKKEVKKEEDKLRKKKDLNKFKEIKRIGKGEEIVYKIKEKGVK